MLPSRLRILQRKNRPQPHRSPSSPVTFLLLLMYRPQPSNKWYTITPPQWSMISPPLTCWTWCSTRTSRETGKKQPGQSGPAPQTGAYPGPAGTLQRIHQRQAETGRLGQQLPGYTAIPIHQNPNAIALGGNRWSARISRPWDLPHRRPRPTVLCYEGPGPTPTPWLPLSNPGPATA